MLQVQLFAIKGKGSSSNCFHPSFTSAACGEDYCKQTGRTEHCHFTQSAVCILPRLCLKISPQIQTTGAVCAQSAAVACARGPEGDARKIETAIGDREKQAALVNSGGCACEVDAAVIRET